jgi:hypothetical protein
MIKNIEGNIEVLTVDKVAIAGINNNLRLTLPNKAGIIFVDVGSNYTAHAEINELLENGWVDLSGYYAGITFPAE